MSYEPSQYYQALRDRDAEYEGIFFVGVKTTGVFCRPTCPARKPKFEHCEFFEHTEEALLAGYRPCKRCRPLDRSGQSPLVTQLVAAVEEAPEKRWSAADLEPLGIDSSTAQRAFKRACGMTFIQYARARRLGLAMKHIRVGESVLDAQLEAGFESGSGFRAAFNRLLGAPPSKAASAQVLLASWLSTPLGPMLAVADDEALVLLEFVERRGLEREMERLGPIVPGRCAPIDSIQRELALYFAGELKTFKTRIRTMGTPFQELVWQELCQIPYGQTRSYGDLAKQIEKPTACRAVARANGANQLALVIPCHRVINADGTIGGYGGRVPRKKWLLEHEQALFRRR